MDKMQTAGDPDTYYQALKKWNEIMDIYQQGGCLPPPPPPIIHEEVPVIELQCHKGYKVGFREAEDWITLVWNDAGRPKTLEVEKIKVWKKKIIHYTRCINQWFESKHSIFHICGKKGLREGITHFTKLYFTEGELAIKEYHEHINDIKTSESYFKASYHKIIKKATPSFCQSKYPLNVLSKVEGQKHRCGPNLK